MFRSALLLVLFIAASGCDQLDDFQDAPETSSLLIAGSSSFLPVTDVLVKKFGKQHKNVIIVTESGGSTAGMLALNRGVIDVASLSRPIRSVEKSYGIKVIPVALNGIGLLVHPDNPVHDLTEDEAQELLSGEFRDWSQVKGGEPGHVQVISRNSTSTTLRGVKDLLMAGDDMVEDAHVTESAEDMVEAVAHDPRAIGFVSLADMEDLPQALQDRVVQVKINGVPMDAETIKSGAYPLIRQFAYAIKEPATPVTHDYINFVLSPTGQAILKAEDLLLVH